MGGGRKTGRKRGERMSGEGKERGKGGGRLKEDGGGRRERNRDGCRDGWARAMGGGGRMERRWAEQLKRRAWKQRRGGNERKTGGRL